MDQLPAYPYRADGWTALGFADVFTLRTPDGRVLLAHLRWCTFADLLLTPATAEIDGPRGLGVALTFATISADDVAERARAAGATILEGPVDRPWNTRDVTIGRSRRLSVDLHGTAARGPRGTVAELRFGDAAGTGRS